MPIRRRVGGSADAVYARRSWAVSRQERARAERDWKKGGKMKSGSAWFGRGQWSRGFKTKKTSKPAPVLHDQHFISEIRKDVNRPLQRDSASGFFCSI